MKKLLSNLIIISMIFTIMFGNVSTGFAKVKQSPKYTLKEAIESTKKALNLTTEGYEFKSNYNEFDDLKTWDLNWYPKNDMGISTDVVIDADTCEVLSMNKYNRNDEVNTKIPKYSKSNALKVAQDFINKLHPEKSKELVLKDTSYSNYYNSSNYDFYFIRKTNGIEFQDSGINVSVDKNNLSIKNYNYNWDRKSLPDSSKAMSIDKAKSIFEDKIGLELSYNLIYNSDSKKPKAILVYSLKDANRPIDALTGELLNNKYYMNERTGSSKQTLSKNDALTPKEKEVVDNNSKYITQDEAIAKVKADSNIKLTNDYKLSNSRLYSYDYLDSSAIWSLNWNYDYNDKDIHNSISVSIDATTGEIKSFSRYGTDFVGKNDSKQKYTQEQAKELAENYLKKVENYKFTQCKFKDYPMSYDENTTSYSFNYVQNYKNALCPFNNLSLTINAYTGETTNYNMNWIDVDLPSQDGCIDLQKAYKTLYDKSKLSLKYIKLSNYKQNTFSSETKLVYSLDDFYGLIDAQKGIILDYDGKPLKDKNPTKFTDIKGSKYETAINLLVEMNILDSDTNKFLPNSNILQKDFIKLVAKTFEPDYYYVQSDNGNEYEKYYNILINKKIISKKDVSENSYVTRQQASKILVRALGVGFVADMDNLYNAPFKDVKSISNSYKGYCTISNGLNIIRADKGLFNPNSKITRGECAQFIINYMKVNLDPQNK